MFVKKGPFYLVSALTVRCFELNFNHVNPFEYLKNLFLLEDIFSEFKYQMALLLSCKISLKQNSFSPLDTNNYHDGSTRSGKKFDFRTFIYGIATSVTRNAMASKKVVY